jgi:hypothetical protein
MMRRTHPTVNQVSQKQNVAFEEGSWGVEIYEGLGPDVEGNGDVVVSKHVSVRALISHNSC